MHEHDEEKLARLYEMLLEDTGSPEEAGALLDTAAQLNAWQAPEPGEAGAAQLIEALTPALPRRKPRRRLEAPMSWWPLLILRAQTRVVRGEIWTASALVMAFGALVTLATFEAPRGDMLPLVLIAPIVTAVGVAFLYGPEVDPAIEIQLATPAPPRLVLLARLALLFGFDLCFGLAGSITLAALQSEVSLWPLVMAWLAPMTFLAALAFLLSVITGDPLTGVVASIGLWSFHALSHMTDLSGLPIPAAIPDLTGEAARPWLWLAGLLMVAAALWLSGREERWAKGWYES